MEARQWNWNGVVEWSRSANLWRPGNLARWTEYRILCPATRADAFVRDASRRHERADCDRCGRPARRTSMGARRAIDNLGGGRSRRHTPLANTGRRSSANGLCEGIRDRSHVGARWSIRCLFGTRHRHNVYGKSGDGRGRNASHASADSDSWSSTPGLPGWRTCTRAPTGRHST